MEEDTSLFFAVKDPLLFFYGQLGANLGCGRASGR